MWTRCYLIPSTWVRCYTSLTCLSSEFPSPWKVAIPSEKSFSISDATLSDCLVSYLGHSFGKVTPLQRCSLYSAAPSDWARHLLEESYPSVEMQSVFSAALSDCARHLLVEFYPSAEIQLLYSIAPVNWAHMPPMKICKYTLHNKRNNFQTEFIESKL